MTHFVGIAITQQFIVGSIYMPRWGALLIVAPAPGEAVAPLQAAWTWGNKGYMKGQAMEL